MEVYWEAERKHHLTIIWASQLVVGINVLVKVKAKPDLKYEPISFIEVKLPSSYK